MNAKAERSTARQFSVAVHFGDPCLGLKLGQSIRAGHLGSHGYALMSCSDGAELMRQHTRYSALNVDAAHIVFDLRAECLPTGLQALDRFDAGRVPAQPGVALMIRRAIGSLVLPIVLLAGCASQPPGSSFPRTASFALPHPEETRLGRRFAEASVANGSNSGFRTIPVGADGFLVRAQMINAAQKTLDLQYFIFRGDETGRLLTEAVLRAADRGVRVRVLIDDGETARGDEQITKLAAHPSVQIRIFNPFTYRGHNKLLRAVDFTLHAPRLDYRMHNKLLVVDNATALIGGRNIGDQYFQMDPEFQVADDDVFAVGPIVPQLSATFDEFWNSDLSVPSEALSHANSTPAAMTERRAAAAEEGREGDIIGEEYRRRASAGEPFDALVSGRKPLQWAHAQLFYDSPDKRKVRKGEMVGRLMRREVSQAVLAVESELLMVTPFLVPGDEGMRILGQLRARQVRVRILTNSLESSTVLWAQAGYMRYRVPLLESGAELHEIRSLLGNAKGSGQSAAISRYGKYSLHAKLFVLDRKRLFVGSMNFDERSDKRNTEIGLLIDSPTLAQEVATRFENMVQPANAYRVALQRHENDAASLVWDTREAGRDVEYEIEPARSSWQRLHAQMLSWVDLDDEL